MAKKKHSRKSDRSPSDPGTPSGRNQAVAREMVHRAGFAESSDEQIALAKKALEYDQGCAAAYMLLAENATSAEEALALYQTGATAALEALGPDALEEFEGRFWVDPETRDFMQALRGVGDVLRFLNRHEEALKVYRQLMNLNPDDDQGIRYSLAKVLLDQECHEELHRLLADYCGDPTPEWAYTGALLAFREEGDSATSRRLLEAADKVNPHVPAYLIGSRPIPADLPDEISVGEESGAVYYAVEFLPAWKNSPGAVSWLRSTLNVTARSRKDPPGSAPPKPPWKTLRKVLERLPQNKDETWEVDIEPFPIFDGPEGRSADPWITIVVDPDSGEALAVGFTPSRPEIAHVWNSLVAAMQTPEEGDPRRPGRIHVRLKSFRTAWQRKLEGIGVACQVVPELEAIPNVISAASGPIAEMAERFFLEDGGDEPLDPGEVVDLPQNVGEIWQADLRRLATWITVDDEPQRPWICMVVTADDRRILATDLRDSQLEAKHLERAVFEAMAHPADQEPRRPEGVQVASEELRAALAPRLAAAGVRCTVSDRLDSIDEMVEDLVDHLSGPQRFKPLINSPGMTAAHLASFFEAAAAFYRAAPWRRMGADIPIKIESEAIQSGPWYAVVMGQSGIELGVALYEDFELLRSLITDTISPEESGRKTSGLSVTFGEAFDIAPEDLDAAERNGWALAGPEAYPCTMRINPGMAIRPPLVWELGLLEACLKALPEFVSAGAGELSKLVPVAGGALPLRLTKASL